jgi:hypothetical protein
MKYSKVSRRMFLESAGKSALAIPFLESLVPSLAYAQTGPKLKFINVASDLVFNRVLATPGYFNDVNRTYNGLDTAPWTQADLNTRYQSLSAIAARHGKLSWIFDQKWNSFINKINIVSNTHTFASDFRHNATYATAAAGGNVYEKVNNDRIDYGTPFSSSVDYVISQATYGTARPAIPVLRVNLHEGSYYRAVGYSFIPASSGALRTQPVFGSENFNHLRNQLIVAGGQLGESQGPISSDPTKPVINQVLEDYKRLQNNRRISSADRSRLTIAMDMWSDFLGKYNPAVPVSQPGKCSVPPAASPVSATDRHKAAMNLVAIALSCGLTRVVSYSLLDLADSRPGTGSELHMLSHGNQAHVNNFYMHDGAKFRADRMHDFTTILANTPDEFGQPLLNSTVIQWNHEFADIGLNMAHVHLGHVVLVVSGSDKFQMGHHIDAGGAPQNRLFVTHMKAMGLNDSQIEIQKNENAGPGFGEYSINKNQSDIERSNESQFAFKGQSLPGPRRFSYEGLEKFLTPEERRKPFYYLKG